MLPQNNLEDNTESRLNSNACSWTGAVFTKILAKVRFSLKLTRFGSGQCRRQRMAKIDPKLKFNPTGPNAWYVIRSGQNNVDR
jgi:hypothetical protein